MYVLDTFIRNSISLFGVASLQPFLFFKSHYSSLDTHIITVMEVQ